MWGLWGSQVCPRKSFSLIIKYLISLIRKPSGTSILSHFKGGAGSSVASCAVGTPFAAIYLHPKHMAGFLCPVPLSLAISTRTPGNSSGQALFSNCFMCWGFLLSQTVSTFPSETETWAERARQYDKEAAAWASVYLRIVETEQEQETVLNLPTLPLGKQVPGFLWFLNLFRVCFSVS